MKNSVHSCAIPDNLYQEAIVNANKISVANKSTDIQIDILNRYIDVIERYNKRLKAGKADTDDYIRDLENTIKRYGL